MVYESGELVIQLSRTLLLLEKFSPLLVRGFFYSVPNLACISGISFLLRVTPSIVFLAAALRAA